MLKQVRVRVRVIVALMIFITLTVTLTQNFNLNSNPNPNPAAVVGAIVASVLFIIFVLLIATADLRLWFYTNSKRIRLTDRIMDDLESATVQTG
jgi:divalent metal cation (Fe/Co/Zn/Cd) transporter